ncbi:16S rRNA (guanine(966)-N(2))-methyltransferase RsmD [Mycoplasmopsis cricetuli]|uniref:16S rRNA (guanine(966)-N(2))-methyltransferase RsmD n=1 Tax=Mycoplasmopsis cricetuli TaxID=171283 RepID=UPI0004725174|nr:16S rRNA (guanine(966)-N(2))-methyltransferase RsmD [Mycoplasmopsis cricetuli]
MLRIIAGIYRNLKIKEPDSNFTRPTTEKVRESIFSSLQFKIANKRCLDLFSGSGAWSIEAESRGAKEIVAIEKNSQVYKVLINNLLLIKSKNITAIQTDALLYLKKENQPFDFIFIDAPFKDFDLVSKSLKEITLKKLLNLDGEIIIETDVSKLIELPDELKIYKQKKHGRIDLLYVCWK